MENTHTAYRFPFMWLLGHHVPVVQGTINLYPRVISYNFHMELIQFRKPYCRTCGLVGKYGSLPVGFPCLAFPSLFSLSLADETNPERRRSRFFLRKITPTPQAGLRVLWKTETKKTVSGKHNILWLVPPFPQQVPRLQECQPGQTRENMYYVCVYYGAFRIDFVGRLLGGRSFCAIFNGPCPSLGRCQLWTSSVGTRRARVLEPKKENKTISSAKQFLGRQWHQFKTFHKFHLAHRWDTFDPSLDYDNVPLGKQRRRPLSNGKKSGDKRYAAPARATTRTIASGKSPIMDGFIVPYVKNWECT